MGKSIDELLQKCKWCNGSGDDGGGYRACPDCESTGLKGGRYALKLHDEWAEKAYQDSLKKQKNNRKEGVTNESKRENSIPLRK